MITTKKEFINIFFIFFFLLISLNTKASTFEENLDVYEDIPYHEQLTLERINKKTGTVSSHKIANDKNIWGFSLHGNASVSTLLDVLTLEITYLRRVKYFWLFFYAQRSKAIFKEIAANNSNIDAENPIPKNTEEIIFHAGGGIGYRSTWIKSFLESIINSENIFEHTTAGLGYFYLDESHYKRSFAGPGLKTDFTILNRFSSSYHLGIKTSYTIASIKKSQSGNDQSSRKRSLSVSWMSIALEFGYYF